MPATFNAVEHTYWLGDNRLISVTQLLKKNELSTDYSAVSADVLNAKAERGSLIHEEIDNYIKSGEVGFTQEFADYLDLMDKLNLIPLANENLVYNDVIAGTYDLKAQRLTNKKIYYIDFKTCAKVDKTSCSWQLSLYEHLDNSENAELLVFHLVGGNSKAIPIDKVPKEDILKLIDSERQGTVYEAKELTVKSELLEELRNVELFIKVIEAQKKEAESRSDKLKADLLKAMKSQKVKKWTSVSGMKLTYIKPTKKESIDSARLREELPEIASKYTKVSPVKASVRITLPKE